MSDPTAVQACANQSYRSAGIALIVVSCVLYVLLLAVPFLPIRSDAQVLLATGLLLSSEGTFWIGCLIAGKDVIARLRAQLWPWPRRRHAPSI